MILIKSVDRKVNPELLVVLGQNCSGNSLAHIKNSMVTGGREPFVDLLDPNQDFDHVVMFQIGVSKTNIIINNVPVLLLLPL